MITTRLCDSKILMDRCNACGRIQDVGTRDCPEAEPFEDCALPKGSPEQGNPCRCAGIMEVAEREGLPAQRDSSQATDKLCMLRQLCTIMCTALCTIK
ncbi:hypothetical protein [Limimaricola hongkongensis]|nr:hypothetical protein [Limimaricola hongkongensis]